MKTDKDIIAEYSDFFRDINNKQKSNMRFGFCCDVGWYPIVEEALEKIDQLEHADFIEITQVKEKYGSLQVYYRIREEFKLKYASNIFKRIYYNIKGFDIDAETTRFITEVDSIIASARSRAVETCELCGKHTMNKRLSDYWVKTVCKSCHQVFESFTYKSTN
jgi:hypothetical protein